MSDHPPRWAERLLGRWLPDSDRDAVLGDLAEEHRRRRRRGRGADRWYLGQALGYGLRLVQLRRQPPAPARPLERARREEAAMAMAWLDLRMAVRGLRRAPGLVVVASLTLALGIGANVALLSVIDGAFLRPLPVPEPERLLWISSTEEGRSPRASNYADLVDLRERTGDLFQGLSAFVDWELSVEIEGESVLVPAELVSRSHFAVLGVEPAAGRFFRSGPEGAAGALEIVLSHGFWSRAFGADPGVIGRALRVGGLPFTVAGVAPRAFRGVDLARSPEAWVALDHYDRLATGFYAWFRATDYQEQRATRRRISMWSAVARLAPGIEPERAAAAVALVGRQLADQLPETHEGFGMVAIPAERASAGLGERGRAVRLMAILLGATGLATLMACANLAQLLLGRAARRRGELALRHALGAGRARVAREVLLESTLLATLGGAAGIGVAWGALRALGGYRLPGGLAIERLVGGIDGGALAATAALVALTTVLFGAGPALRASRPDLALALAGGGGRGVAGGAPLRWGLISTQVALSLALLLGAGLFLRSLHRALSSDLGFDPDGAVTARVDLGMQRFDEERAELFVRGLLERVRAIPGVTAASVTSSPFGDSALGVGGVLAEGSEWREGVEVELAWIESRYPETLGVPLLEGRGLGAETSGGRAALVNRRLAETLWPGSPAVGRRFKFSDDPESAWFEVVGVVGDTRHFGLAGEAPRFAFFDLEDDWSDAVEKTLTLVARTSLPPGRLAEPLRRAFVDTDPTVPIAGLETLETRVAAYAMPQRLGSLLLGGFAASALLLACLGIYGVVASAVARRRGEIGVRIALGASRSRVLALVLWESAGPALLGLLAGLAIAWAGARSLEAFLFEVEPLDPLVWLVAPLLLALVGLLAGVIPARGAMRVDPAVTLRQE